jgi:hypothetical protein
MESSRKRETEINTLNLGKKNIPEKLRIAELMVDLLRFGVRNSK